ncbi:MAG: ATP-binding protein [Acidobacteriota bacterium]|nr:ATP-binding protein [Acidobacteriota bacterium]
MALSLRHDEDVVAGRRSAAQVAALLNFDVPDQTRIATAVSEIVRNAFRYGVAGTVQFELDLDGRPQQLRVRVEDRGPGIPHLQDVLGGRFQSGTGMGVGISGARRLMDRFAIESSPEGTRVLLARSVPARAPVLTRARAGEIAAALRQRKPRGLVEEVQQQNQELLSALNDLELKQQELARLNRELEDTNRGVVALYAELDEKADHLRRADDLKSRFLSNMTHEFRTPVNAIIGLCNLLRDERARDGRKVEPELDFILKAAEQLSTLVNDLLDLAKVEAGKTVVNAETFEIQNLFGALRGLLRPLLLTQSVALVFEDAADLPPIHTDEAKLSQVLRNLISNGLKFTERGEVRVSASLDEAAARFTFRVADTGIGVATDDQSIIFEEFGQIEHRLQRKSRGTGLGLPLARRLAELLGGALTVASEPGVGSIFSVVMPMTYTGAPARDRPIEWNPDPAKVPLLVINDAPDAAATYEKMLGASHFQPCTARNAGEIEAALDAMAPGAIVMELAPEGAADWDLLIRLRRDDRTRHVPLVVAAPEDVHGKALALGADACLASPMDRHRLLDAIGSLHARLQSAVRVLSIDDEELARYLVRQCLPLPGFELTEARDGAEGLRRAKADQPDVIVLDLVMPGISGQELLVHLRADPLTRHIPVVIVTGARLLPADLETLRREATAVMSKSDLSRHTLPDIVRSSVRRGI